MKNENKIQYEASHYEANLISLLDNSNDSTWSVDKNYNFIIFNKYLKTICKKAYNVELKAGLNALEFFSTELKALWKTNYDLALKGEKVIFEFYEDILSQRYYIEVHLNPIIDNGIITGTTALGVDITSRNNAELKIAKQEARINSIFRAAPIGIGVVSNRMISEVNDRFCEMTGYSREELIGKNSVIVYPTNKEFEWVGKYKYEQIQKYGTGTVETQFKRKDGKLIDVILSSTPIDIKNMSTGVTFTALDITDRKQVKKELEENEDRLSKTLIAANEGMWDWNLTTNKVYFDPRYYKMAGYAVDEFPYELDEFQKRIHPDDAENVMGQAQLHIEGKVDRFRVTFRFKKKSGDWFWVLGRGQIVERDKDNKPLRFIGTHLDITERKQAEERLKILFDFAPDAYFLSDITGIFIDGNKAAENLSGYKKDELIGKNYLKLKLLSAKEILKASKLLLKIVQGKGTGPNDFILNCKDGSKVNIEIITHPVKLKNKTVVLAIARDITERKLFEKELEKLNVAVRQSPVSIIIANSEGLIEYVNPTFEKLTGYTFEESIGKNPNILKSNLTPVTSYKELWDTIKKGDTWKGELVNKKKSGELYWDSVTISSIKDDKNNITNFISIQVDITEKKQNITDLIDREEKYRTLTQNLNVGVYRSTPGKNGKFIESNPAFLNIFGFKSKDELSRWKVRDLYVYKNERYDLEKNLLTKGFVHNYQASLRRKDGSIFMAALSTTAARDDQEKIIHYDGILEDISERNEIQKQLINYQTNLKLLTNDLIETEESTKRDLAISLHDTLGQSLVMAKFKISELNKIVASSKNKKLVNEVNTYIEDAISESRNITYELSPPVLYEMGLIPAISWKLDDIEKNNNIKTSFVNQSKSYKFDEKTNIVLYRVICESLQNIIKHAEAQSIKIKIRLLKKSYRISIIDDGKGFDIINAKRKAVAEKKFGLFSIFERIRFIGGELDIKNVSPNGIITVINLPIKINKQL